MVSVQEDNTIRGKRLENVVAQPIKIASLKIGSKFHHRIGLARRSVECQRVRCGENGGESMGEYKTLIGREEGVKMTWAEDVQYRAIKTTIVGRDGTSARMETMRPLHPDEEWRNKP